MDTPKLPSQSRKFSPMSLNLLMLVCLVLIIIFSQAPKDESRSSLPPVPKLHIDQWRTDSGGKVWFSPMFGDTLEVQLWYQAGFAYDGEHKGKAQLLAQLLKYESRQRKLDMEVSLDQDFLKLSISLNKTSAVLNQQVDQIVELLYRPQLPNQLLTQLVSLSGKQHGSASQALLDQLYPAHPYAGPKQGSNSNLTRKDLQVFQQSHMHPKRLHMAIVGDIDRQGARVISERLLPVSKYVATHSQAIASQGLNYQEMGNQGGLVWPNKQEKLTALDHYMTYQILNQLHENQVRFTPGLASNTLFIGRSQQLRERLEDNLDTQLIAQAKRTLLKNWLTQLQTPKGLSRQLVQLNANGFAINELALRRNALLDWDQDHWENVSGQLLAPMLDSNFKFTPDKTEVANH